MSEPRNSPSSRHIVGLVARREFTTRALSKAFLISTAVILAVLIGGQIIFAVVSSKDDATTIGVVGDDRSLSVAVAQSAKALGQSIDIRKPADEAKARSQIKEGDLDLALIGKSDGSFAAVSKKDIGTQLQGVVDSATRQIALDRALASQHVDTDALAKDLAKATVSIDVLEPSDPDKYQRMGLAYIAVFLLFFTVYLYGLYVAMGIVEEKSSRVVELLLSTIKPLDLLAGKVIGIGAVGLLQVVLFGAAALFTGLVTGLVTIGSTAVAVFAAAVIWYILGFAFFAVLYAALGSLVSRQEDVNTATMPLNILAFAMFVAAQASLNTPDSTLISTLSWIPPFSSTLMPMRVAAGVTGPVQIIATIVIMLLAIAVVAVFAARVYESSVLNTGARQSLKRALSKSR